MSNSSMAGIAVTLLESNGKEIWVGRHFSNEYSSQNEALYMSLDLGLRCAKSMGVESVVLQGKSDLIYQQLKGNFKVKSEKLQPLYFNVMEILQSYRKYEIRDDLSNVDHLQIKKLCEMSLEKKTSIGFAVCED